jgi:hypothetical protein
LSLVPIAASHLNAAISANAVSILADTAGANADGCRYLNAVGGLCLANRGPSGTYVDASNGVFAEVGSMPVHANVEGAANLLLFARGWFGTSDFARACDFEVLSDGVPLTGDEDLDETAVDDGAGNGGTKLPDGTFDDGGDGAVCHVRTYVDASFNAVGCAAEGSAAGGVAHAEDVVSGPDVWLTANCDYLSYTNDEHGGLNCLVNELAQGKVPVVLVGCAAEILAGLLTPLASLPTPTCGGDGIQDGAKNYGDGGGDWPGLGVAYPAILAGCFAADATAMAAVMHSIQLPGPIVVTGLASGSVCDLPTPCAGIDAVGPANVGPLHVNLYTLGWIDWNAGNAGPLWSDGGGVDVQVLPAQGCANMIDDNGDGAQDADDSACHSDGNNQNPLSYDPTLAE